MGFVIERFSGGITVSEGTRKEMTTSFQRNFCEESFEDFADLRDMMIETVSAGTREIVGGKMKMSSMEGSLIRAYGSVVPCVIW